MAPRSSHRMEGEEGAMSGHLPTVRAQHRPACLWKPVRVQRVTQQANMTRTGCQGAALTAECSASNDLPHKGQHLQSTTARDTGLAGNDFTNAYAMGSALPKNGESAKGEMSVHSNMFNT